MTTVDFVAFPRTVTTGGSVRLFPIVTGNLTPIISYAWYWGWTSAVLDSTEATPIATNVGSELTDGTVALIVTDSAGSYTVSKAAYITVAAASTVPDIPTDGTYQKVSVFIYDDTYSMLVNRTPTAICKLYLLKPQIINVLDKSPTTTFQLLDVGDSTATEKLLIAEGKYVIVIQGKDIIFSGIIRRASRDTQLGFAGVTQVKLWNIECDSDLMRLAKTNVYKSTDYTTLLANGKPIEDTPGNIARLILAPAPGAADWRGNICCNDTKVTYQITSTSALVEEVASQYDHITTLRDISNYDLITRRDFSAYTYTSFDGTATITMSGGVPAYITAGSWIFFTTDHLKGTPETINTGGCLAYGKCSGGSPTTIVLSPMYGAASVPLTTDVFICAKSPLVDFAPDLSTPSALVTLNVNSNFYDCSDNDDKRKLATKIIAKAKDINGKSISVSLVACHAYDDEKQFFNDCTFISKRSEGYIYSNSFLIDERDCTALLGDGGKLFTTSVAGGDHLSLFLPAGTTTFVLNQEVEFFVTAGTLPAPLSIGQKYYVVARADVGSAIAIAISSTIGGSAIYLTSDAIAFVFIACNSQIRINNTGGVIGMGTEIVFYGTVMPSGGTGLTAGVVYNCGTPALTSAVYVFTVLLAGVVQKWSAGGTSVKTHRIEKGIDTTFPSTSSVNLYGWNYVLPVGTTFVVRTPGTSAVTELLMTTTGAAVESVEGSGEKITKVSINLWLSRDYKNLGYFLNSKFWVNKAADVYSVPATILFGEEPIPITSTITDATYGDCLVCNPTLRIPSNTLKAYPHDIGCLVAKTNCSETAPETGSPLRLYGLSSNAPVVDANVTYGQLDAYVTTLLLGFGSFYKKAAGWLVLNTTGVKRVGMSAVQPSLTTSPRVGDSVAVVEYSGATAENYEIVSVTIKCDEGVISLELGDYEKNVFTSLQQATNAINKTLT